MRTIKLVDNTTPSHTQIRSAQIIDNSQFTTDLSDVKKGDVLTSVSGVKMVVVFNSKPLNTVYVSF